MKKKKFKKAVLLLSGGLDSAANLALGTAVGEIALALTVEYGQRAFESEKRAAQALAGFYGVPQITVDLKWLGGLGGSSLTDRTSAVPKILETELDHKEKTKKSAQSVWVPNRNGVMIQVAAAHAERIGAEVILVGFNKEEAATFPDNSTGFMAASTEALKFSTRNQVKVQSFTDRLDKTQIVAQLLKIQPRFPFEQVWSCYHSGLSLCGQCESCRRFARALSQNGLSLQSLNRKDIH